MKLQFQAIGGSQNDGLLRASNEVIYFRKFREGKGEIFRSTRTKDLARARKVRDEIMQEIWGLKGFRSKRLTVVELFPKFIDSKKATSRQSSIDSLTVGWNNMRPYLEHMFIDEITNDWWLTVYVTKKRLEENPRKGIDNTKRKFFNEWKWLSMFLKWCVTSDKVDSQFKRPKLINPDPPTPPGKVYSDDELESLNKNATLRMSACLVAGEQHFMRRSEIRLLEWDRVDMAARTIKLRSQDTKTKKPRIFPFNDEFESLLIQLANESIEMDLHSSFVFPTLVSPTSDQPMSMTEFRNMWEGCYRKAGLPKGSRFHWLRHTGLTKAFKRPGANSALICFFAGLSLEEAQATYLHFTIDDLRGVENLVGSK